MEGGLINLLNKHVEEIRNSFRGYQIDVIVDEITMVIHFKSPNGNIRGCFHAIGNYGFGIVNGKTVKITSI